MLQQCVELVMTSGVARISEWEWGFGGLPEAIRGLGAEPPALGDFCNFFKK